MNIQEVATLIEGEIICSGDNPMSEITTAFASDLMSDVLTLTVDNMLLITGLANMQTIRTAEMADIKNILFVRNKKPNPEMINLARSEGINLLTTKKSMFLSCGILYQADIKPIY